MADIGIGADLGGIAEGAVGQDRGGGAQDRVVLRKKQEPKNGTTSTTKKSKPKEETKVAADDKKPSPKLAKKLRRGRVATILSGVTEEDASRVLLGGRPAKRG